MVFDISKLEKLSSLERLFMITGETVLIMGGALGNYKMSSCSKEKLSFLSLGKNWRTLKKQVNLSGSLLLIYGDDKMICQNLGKRPRFGNF